MKTIEQIIAETQRTLDAADSILRRDANIAVAGKNELDSQREFTRNSLNDSDGGAMPLGWRRTGDSVRNFLRSLKMLPE